MTHYFAGKSIEETLKDLNVDRRLGLTTKEVHDRLVLYGANRFSQGRKNTFLSIFLKQIKNPLVFILIIADIITLFLSQYLDAIVLFIALFINIIIGAVEEGRADKSFE